MKNISLVILSTLILLTRCISQDSVNNDIDRFFESLERKQNALLDKPFPPLLIEGNSFYETELKGKVTLIDFWFAGCKPCFLEFNALSALRKKFESNRSFQLISITYEKKDVIEAIKRNHILDFRIITTSKEEFEKLLQGTGCPVNVILNKKGIVKFWKSGGEVSAEKSNQFFEKNIYPRILNELANTFP